MHYVLQTGLPVCTEHCQNDTVSFVLRKNVLLYLTLVAPVLFPRNHTYRRQQPAHSLDLNCDLNFIIVAKDSLFLNSELGVL